MSFLREPGDLGRTPLAAILLEAWSLRATGEFTVLHPDGDSHLYFRDGLPVGAQTYASFQPLGQILLARGLIDLDTLGRSLAEIGRTRRPQGEILVEMGAVSQEDIDRALRAQQSVYLSLISNLSEGAYRFSFDAPIPPWANRVLVAPLRAVVDALATPQGAPLCGSALAFAEGALAFGSGYSDLSLVFAWTETEELVLRRIESACTAEEILATPGIRVEAARAVLAALLLLGLVEPAGDVVDLGTLGLELTPVPVPLASPVAPPLEPPAPARRSDPDEARLRRRRLLVRAMRNMGVGPGSAPPAQPAPVAPAAPAAPVAPAAPAAPGAPTPQESEIRRALEAALPAAKDPDLFVRMGLPRGATPEEVKAAYLAMVRKFHPDRYATPALADLQPGLRDLLSGLNEAYSVLSDRALRADYLARTSAGGRAPTAAAAASARSDFQKAEIARKAGDHARARLFLEAAVRSDRSPDMLAALAQELVALGKPADRDKARLFLEEAMRDPACTLAFLVGGRLAEADGDNDRAEKLYRGVFRSDPTNEEAKRELRRLEGRRQSRAEARADAKKR